MPNSAQEYAQAFMSHRGALLDLLNQLPGEQATFSAWPGGMSFWQLTDHLSGSAMRMGALLAGQTPEKPQASESWNAALERIHTNTQATYAALAAMTPEQLLSSVPAFGGNLMQVSRLVELLIGHEIHHKGQVWLMARMIGLEPPRYIKL